MVALDVQSPNKSPREIVEYKRRPFVKALLASFNEYNAIVKSRVWKFSLITDFVPGTQQGGLAWTRGNQIYLCLDNMYQGKLNIDTTLDPKTHPEEINFARFLMMHEIVHNLYAPESLIQQYTAQRLISDGKVGQIYPDAVVSVNKWNDVSNTWRTLGDILVNGHICENPVPPSWGVPAKEFVTIGIERSGFDVTLGRPNSRQQIRAKHSDPVNVRYLDWNDYFIKGRQDPPETGRARELVDAFVSFTGSSTKDIDKFYTDFYELVSVW